MSQEAKHMSNTLQKLTNTADQTLDATERVVAELWREVLQADQPPQAADNFFACGGDSMSMIILEFRITEELLVELPSGAVLGAPTLRELSALVDAARSGFPAAHVG
jgi:acyl carrier protein